MTTANILLINNIDSSMEPSVRKKSYKTTLTYAAMLRVPMQRWTAYFVPLSSWKNPKEWRLFCSLDLYNSRHRVNFLFVCPSYRVAMPSRRIDSSTDSRIYCPVSFSLHTPPGCVRNQQMSRFRRFF